MKKHKSKKSTRRAKQKRAQRATAERLELATKYEQVTWEILQKCRQHFGLVDIHPKGLLVGRAAHPVEIDVFAHTGQNRLFLVECRRHMTKNITQEQVYALVGKISDLNAAGGMMISPKGYQVGARKVAKAYGIHLAQLNEDATARDYVLKLADRLFAEAEAKGGILVSGSAEVGVRFFVQGSGGPAVGGRSALVSANYYVIGSGGLVIT